MFSIWILRWYVDSNFCTIIWKSVIQSLIQFCMRKAAFFKNFIGGGSKFHKGAEHRHARRPYLGFPVYTRAWCMPSWPLPSVASISLRRRFDELSTEINDNLLIKQTQKESETNKNYRFLSLLMSVLVAVLYIHL